MFKMIEVAPSEKYHQLKVGDDGFYFTPDNLTIVPRAGFEINEKCPREYKLIIAECINNGWIKPVAHCTDQELVWQKLKK
jgi:hypothetical protein